MVLTEKSLADVIGAYQLAEPAKGKYTHAVLLEDPSALQEYNESEPCWVWANEIDGVLHAGPKVNP